MTHITEANALIANVNNSGPQSWLLTLTKYKRSFRISFARVNIC